jgi:hypothetical protein
MLTHTRPKTCQQCGKLFAPFLALAIVCSAKCAIKQGKAKKAVAKVALKARKEAIKKKGEYVKEAQTAFNAYIRERDRGKDCICCPGTPLGSGTVGGAFDCGHYRSVGSAPHLRFHEDNAAGQNKRCNRYGSGRAVDYRIGLAGRSGIARVEALEADNTARHFSKDDLKAIRATYQSKLKQLKERA